MEKRKPLILISNDDGITAKGVSELIAFLRPLGEIVVMVPDAPRSGSGCALTVTRPVGYQLVRKEEGVTVYTCTGTPVDCIKLARHNVLSRQPDLVVGGINHGDNSATSVHYSGTMGVVIEGCLNGIPSVGFSLCSHAADADFEPSRNYVQQIAAMVLEKGLPREVCLNVNIPLTTELKGIRICKQTMGVWVHEWEPSGQSGEPDGYRLSGTFVDEEPDNEQSDHWALTNGYVAVTPITVDMTAYHYLDELTAQCRQITPCNASL